MRLRRKYIRRSVEPVADDREAIVRRAAPALRGRAGEGSAVGEGRGTTAVVHRLVHYARSVLVVGPRPPPLGERPPLSGRGGGERSQVPGFAFLEHNKGAHR
ncbi:hypothetical protein GCM10029964_093060 [Kibdelosporangium lantanae]